MPERDDGQPRVRPFWSGTLTFGLVSIPVDLYAANRSGGVALRMLSPDGVPLARRYYCPEEDVEVPNDELVRGYEIEKGKFVPVSDEELEALEPRRSRDIDLRQFVPADSVDPLYFERAYFLAPGGGSAKAYRLLADAIERERRAGIATFVMRGREYLIAIFAENGILRAETLRFHDELRSIEDIGLPEPAKPSRTLVRRFEKAIEAAAEQSFDESELRDTAAERLIALAEDKQKAGTDVVHAPAGVAEEAEGEADVIDIMQVLKQRIRAVASASETAESTGNGAPAKRRTRAAPKRATARRSAARRSAAKASKESRTGRTDGRRSASGQRRAEARGTDLEARSRDELYRQAQERDIPGRSGMSKRELIQALRRSG